MLSILRLLLTVALIYGLVQAARVPAESGGGTDMTGVFWIAYCVVLAILTAVAWVPWFGEKASDPATGPMTQGAFFERSNRLLAAIRSLERRGWRRTVRWLAVIEGVRHPWLPGAFIAGLNTAAPGSWLERVYAREVLRFNNVDNCVRAYRILRDHGETPPPHRNDNINSLLVSLDRSAAPDPTSLPVPEAPPPAMPGGLRLRVSPPPEPGEGNAEAESPEAKP